MSNPTPETISASELVAPLASSMPEPTIDTESKSQPSPDPKPEPVEKPAPAEKPPAAQVLGKDTLGREFDPSKFRPEKDILGRWKNLHNRGNPKGASPKVDPVQRPPVHVPNLEDTPLRDSVIPPDEPAAAASTPAPVDGKADKYQLAAETYLRGAYSLLDGAFAGKGEWMPDDDAEHVALRDTLSAWLRSRQSDDLPPGAVFAIAAIGFGAKRIQRPNTGVRWRLWWLNLRAWWGNRQAQAKLSALSGTDE